MTHTVLALLFAATLGLQSTDLVNRSRVASEAMERGRFEEAAQIYRELLKSLPNDAGLLMNLGMALAMGGHEPEAIASLERAIKLKPSLLPAQLFLGSSYLEVGAPEKAIAPLKRVIAVQPANIEYRRLLARAYADAGRPVDAAGELRRITELAPKLPAAWYALFHAYNAIAQDALASFANEPETSPWRDLLVADALLSDGRFVDAFAIYRETLAALPSMASVHDAVAKIYEQTGHVEWAAVERSKVRVAPSECTKRQALCEFRAGRYRTALTAALSRNDHESRYWRARAATELAKSAFNRLDALPDSRERREIRATLALADRRHADAVSELKGALKFTPDDVSLFAELGTTHHLMREYEQAIATLHPLVTAPDMGDSKVLAAYGDALLQLERVDEAVPFLRRAFAADTTNPGARSALARAYLQQRDFAAAIPLLEPQLATDTDGSVHVQLSRAYTGLGQQAKAEALLAKSEEIQRAAQERQQEAAKRMITPPK